MHHEHIFQTNTKANWTITYVISFDGVRVRSFIRM